MNAIVYPYCKAAAPFISGIKENFNVDELYVCAPPVLAPEGSDAGFIDNTFTRNISVINEWKEYIDSCQLLIVPYVEEDIVLNEQVEEIILYAIENGIDVIDLFNAYNCEYEEKASGKVEYRSRDYYDNLNQGRGLQTDRPYMIKQPTIYVGKSNSPIVNEYAVEEIAKSVNEKGYVATEIYANPNAVLCGKICIPMNIVTGLQKGDYTYVVSLKEFVDNLSMNGEHDVFIIQCIGGATKYSNIIPDVYGIPTYLMSMAVMPDCFVMCTPALEMYDDNFVDYFSKEFYKKYNFGVDAIITTNVFLDTITTVVLKKLTTLFVDSEYSLSLVSKLKDNGNKLVYSQFDKKDMDLLAEKLINKLSE